MTQTYPDRQNSQHVRWGLCRSLHNSKATASLHYSAPNRSWAILHLLISLKTPKKRSHSNSATNPEDKVLSLLYLKLKPELFQSKLTDLNMKTRISFFKGTVIEGHRSPSMCPVMHL